MCSVMLLSLTLRFGTFKRLCNSSRLLKFAGFCTYQDCLELPENNMIVLIDTQQKLTEFTGHILNDQSERLMGLDTEWRPFFNRGAVRSIDADADIHQLSGTIVDADVVTVGDWERTLGAIFQRSNFRKLTYGFQDDIRMIEVTFPWFRNRLRGQMQNFVCLRRLVGALTRMEPRFIDGMAELVGKGHLLPAAAVGSAAYEAKIRSIHNNWSLSDLCHYFIGRRLKKTDDLTIYNWENRPLPEVQLNYACLDAYCEILLYRAMRKRALELNIDFDAAVNRIQTSPASES